jgi:hypothetical protein
MKRKCTQIAEPGARATETAPATSAGFTHADFVRLHPEAEFLDTKKLLALLPVSRGTLMNWRRLGKIPFILTPGRRILFHLPSVREALLRAQRHAQEAA